MKRKITLTLTLMTSMLLSLVSFTTAQGQTGRKPISDTGVITLGPNQLLRLTVAAGDVNGDAIAVQFRQAAYTPAGCNDGVCKHTVVSQSTSAPVKLMPGEAASIDILSNSFGVRAMVLSNSQNVRVNAMIVDATTGNIICILVD